MKRSLDSIYLSQLTSDRNKKRTRTEYKSLRVPVSREERLKKFKSGYWNTNRNRYGDILPIEKTRVKLFGLKTDYINANYITLPVSQSDEYISTQAPTSYTARDFWKMVWDHNVSVVVMLTSFIEGGYRKANKYWTDKSDGNNNEYNWKEFIYHPSETLDETLITIKVRVNKHRDLGFCIYRYFEVQLTESNGHENKTSSKYIHHFHYKKWGDHKVPASVSDVNTLIYSMNILKKDGKVVVHCSAGIGRSGTFLGCSIIRGLLVQGIEPNIPLIVKGLRECREGMIQTMSQYNFLYHYKNTYFNSVNFLN